jgi:hypothetical protein
LIGKPEGYRQLARYGLELEDKMEISVKEVAWENMDFLRS